MGEKRGRENRRQSVAKFPWYGERKKRVRGTSGKAKLSHETK